MVVSTVISWRRVAGASTEGRTPYLLPGVAPVNRAIKSSMFPRCDMTEPQIDILVIGQNGILGPPRHCGSSRSAWHQLRIRNGHQKWMRQVSAGRRRVGRVCQSHHQQLKWSFYTRVPSSPAQVIQHQPGGPPDPVLPRARQGRKVSRRTLSVLKCDIRV